MSPLVDKTSPARIFIRYGLAALITFIFGFPYFNMLVLSLNDAVDLMYGYPVWLPRVWSFANYEMILSSSLVQHAFFVSVARTVVTTTLGLICNSMLAYALTRKELLGKAFFNQFFITTMYISGGLIPMYLQIRNLKLINNFWVFVLPSIIVVYYVLIMKSYFNSLPSSVEESAKMDGCNDTQVFFMIIIPMSIPVLAAIGVYYAIGQWNAWWDNYIYANTRNLNTLQLVLVRMIKEADLTVQMTTKAGGTAAMAGANPVGLRMATAIVATVPILVVYPFFQKYFISGITLGAVKG